MAIGKPSGGAGIWLLEFALCLACSAPVLASVDQEALRSYLQQSYPSLRYVERYRHDFPNDVHGFATLWSAAADPGDVAEAQDLIQALGGLADAHVRLAGPMAGASETLGVLFRTSTDGHMIVWRVFAPHAAALREGDEVVSIDGTPTAAWLERAAARTFGGNHRSRVAAAAVNLGVASRVVHRVTGLDTRVNLVVQDVHGARRSVALSYEPMNAERAKAYAAALNRSDLPRLMTADGYRIGTLRLGAFAPQYDASFIATSAAAEKVPGASEDQAMVAGFCAVVSRFAAEFDALSARSDVLVLDLRGNLGGFGREARLLAAAMTPAAIAQTYDVFAAGKPGALRLVRQPADARCGRAPKSRPIVVFIDAGTSSSGEFMATWLWLAGAVVVGERTIGAGGGRDADARGFLLPQSGWRILASGNFSTFDPTGRLEEGEVAEAAWVEQMAIERFSPSRNRPFSIQAVGLQPDEISASVLADLRDGGVNQIRRTIERLRARGMLPKPHQADRLPRRD